MLLREASMVICVHFGNVTCVNTMLRGSRTLSSLIFSPAVLAVKYPSCRASTSKQARNSLLGFSLLLSKSHVLFKYSLYKFLRSIMAFRSTVCGLCWLRCYIYISTDYCHFFLVLVRFSLYTYINVYIYI